MNKQPLVSIIMPAYNCEPYIRQAIESILNQTYTNLELLVADDGSKDKTREIIDSYGDIRIKKHHNQTNLSYGTTRNKLLTLAKGEFIAFQDADDYSALERIATQLSAFATDQDLFMCGTNFCKIDRYNNFMFESNFPTTYDELKTLTPENIVYYGASMMIKREVYLAIGGYHPYFNRINAEDQYWINRIIDSYKTINLATPLYFYRYNPNSVTTIVNDEKKYYSTQIAHFLTRERREKGTDSLQKNDMESIQNFIKSLNIKQIKREYFENYKKMMYHFFWEGDYQLGFIMAYRLLKKQAIQPLNFYRDLIYFLRKYLRQ